VTTTSSDCLTMDNSTNHSHLLSVLGKWKIYFYIHRNEITDFVDHTKSNVATEIFDDWVHLVHTKQMGTVQCFLKVFTTKTYTITVPLPVTLDKLDEEQDVGSSSSDDHEEEWLMFVVSGNTPLKKRCCIFKMF
jgi:hypothetical protein